MMFWGFVIALGCVVNLFSPTDPSVPPIVFVLGTILGVWLMWRGYLRYARGKDDEDRGESGTDGDSA
jgi:hypothetical protein